MKYLWLDNIYSPQKMQKLSHLWQKLYQLQSVQIWYVGETMHIIKKKYSNIFPAFQTSVLEIAEHRNLIYDSYRFLVFDIEVFRLWGNDMHINNFCGGIDNLQGLYMFLIHLKASKMYDCRFSQDTRILRNFGVYFWKENNRIEKIYFISYFYIYPVHNFTE